MKRTAEIKEVGNGYVVELTGGVEQMRLVYKATELTDMLEKVAVYIGDRKFVVRER